MIILLFHRILSKNIQILRKLWLENFSVNFQIQTSRDHMNSVKLKFAHESFSLLCTLCVCVCLCVSPLTVKALLSSIYQLSPFLLLVFKNFSTQNIPYSFSPPPTPSSPQRFLLLIFKKIRLLPMLKLRILSNLHEYIALHSFKETSHCTCKSFSFDISVIKK